MGQDKDDQTIEASYLKQILEASAPRLNADRSEGRARLNPFAVTVDICLRYLYDILARLEKRCLNTLLHVSTYKNASGLDPASKKAFQLALKFQSTFLRYIQLNLYRKLSPYHVEATLC